MKTIWATNKLLISYLKKLRKQGEGFPYKKKFFLDSYSSPVLSLQRLHYYLIKLTSICHTKSRTHRSQ